MRMGMVMAFVAACPPAMFTLIFGAERSTVVVVHTAYWPPACASVCQKTPPE